jgi:hypothetical protein
MTNAGTGALTIKSVVASAEFSEVDNCIGVVPPGAGCTIQVGFQPSATGTVSGSLTIADDAVASGAQ